MPPESPELIKLICLLHYYLDSEGYRIYCIKAAENYVMKIKMM